MWSVDTLFGLSGQDFEDERTRIISEYIGSLPEDERHKAAILQINLDLRRAKMTPDEFMRCVTAELKESLENLGDQLQFLVNTMVAK